MSRSSAAWIPSQAGPVEPVCFSVEGGRSAGVLVLGLLSLLALACTSAPEDVRSGSRSDRPHVVLVYADDFGLSLVSAFNDELGFRTDHIDGLVRQGVSFTNAHSSASVCSPSRYTLLTGRYHWRTRLKEGNVGQWERPLIRPSRVTLAEMLAHRGYRTGMLGKWHLGWHWPDGDGGRTDRSEGIDFSAPIPGGPVDHGFESYFGSDIVNYAPFGWWSNDRIVSDLSDTLRDDRWYISGGPADRDWSFSRALPRLVDRAREYIHDYAGGNRPFFLYLSLTAPHDPVAPSAAYRGISGKGDYVDFVIETDAVVGAVLDALSDSGIRRETVVIFMGDNGTSMTFSQPEELRNRGVDVQPVWRGGKGDIYEGGTRTPFVVSWPERFASGTRLDLAVSQADLYATLADLTGYSRSATDGVDSWSLLPMLKGTRRTWDTDRYVVTHAATRGGSTFAVRDGSEKLVARGDSLEFYDLRRDSSETENLADERSARRERLLGAFREMVESGRSTPGPTVRNHRGRVWWTELPWERPSER